MLSSLWKEKKIKIRETRNIFREQEKEICLMMWAHSCCSDSLQQEDCTASPAPRHLWA